MSDPPVRFPTQKDALQLHQRLLDQDVIAPSDLAKAFLTPLIEWLAHHHRPVADEIREQAAEDAILSLIKKPRSYDPKKSSLEAYLCMSAQGDMRNLLRRETSYRQKHISWQTVELSDVDGKYLGKDDDPLLPLQIEEAVDEWRQAHSPEILAGLTAEEKEALELMMRGEKKTELFAKALGIDHLPFVEQKTAVKRIKDKLQKRLQRKGGKRGQAS